MNSHHNNQSNLAQDTQMHEDTNADSGDLTHPQHKDARGPQVEKSKSD